MYLEDTGAPLSAYFDQGAKTLIIKLGDPSDEDGQAGMGMRGGGAGSTGALGSMAAALRGQGAGGRGRAGNAGQQQHQLDRPPAEHYAQWLASLPPVTNLGNLAPVALPLKVGHSTAAGARMALVLQHLHLRTAGALHLPRPCSSSSLTVSTSSPTRLCAPARSRTCSSSCG